MADSFTEVTSTSWLGRIKDALGGLIVGAALFLVSFPLLFWNEGRAVATAQALTEGAGAVVSVSADKLESANEGRLVHMTGPAATTDTLSDPSFGVSGSLLRLRRKVEMYQWVEKKTTKTEKQLGGSEVKTTVYSYDKKWAAQPIDSASFKEAVGHTNPAALPVSADSWTAGKITVGAFTLSPSLTESLNNFTPYAASAPAKDGWTAAGGGYYKGANPASPQVGDARVTFEAVTPGTISLVSKQLGASFEPYRAKNGRTIELLETGPRSAQEMFKAAEAQNSLITWLLRAGGFLLMFFGVSLFFKPLIVIADFIPFLGSILSVGQFVLALVIAGSFTLVTIAVAWIFYRPLLGGALLAVAAVLLVKGLSGRGAHAAAPAAGAH